MESSPAASSSRGCDFLESATEGIESASVASSREALGTRGLQTDRGRILHYGYEWRSVDLPPTGEKTR